MPASELTKRLFENVRRYLKLHASHALRCGRGCRVSGSMEAAPLVPVIILNDMEASDIRSTKETILLCCLKGSCTYARETIPDAALNFTIDRAARQSGGSVL